MAVTGVDTTQKSAAGTPIISANGGTMDKNAFLKLLIAQMSNQDPLKPMDDTQYVSQLAQFSSLEQMQNMNTNMSSLLNTSTMTQSTSWIGKAAQWTDTNTGKTLVGQVKSVSFQDGAAHLIIPMQVSVKGTDGKTTTQIQDTDVPMSSVTNVFEAEDTAGISAALGWTGRGVTGTDLDTGKSITGTVTGVEFRNGLTLLKVQVGDTTKNMALANVASVSG